MGKKLRMLERSFYSRGAMAVARDLLGKIMVRQWRHETLRARIVETEAYVGAHDLACHASKGRTNRTEVMFGAPGHAYVYLIYGMYDMFNIVTGARDDAQAVLVRAAEPLDGWQANLTGPGRLARGLHITRADNGLDLVGAELFFIENPVYNPRIVATKRVGVDYAAEWKEAPLRFYDADSKAVSSA